MKVAPVNAPVLSKRQRRAQKMACIPRFNAQPRKHPLGAGNRKQGLKWVVPLLGVMGLNGIGLLAESPNTVLPALTAKPYFLSQSRQFLLHHQQRLNDMKERDPASTPFTFWEERYSEGKRYEALLAKLEAPSAETNHARAREAGPETMFGLKPFDAPSRLHQQARSAYRTFRMVLAGKLNYYANRNCFPGEEPQKAAERRRACEIMAQLREDPEHKSAPWDPASTRVYVTGLQQQPTYMSLAEDKILDYLRDPTIKRFDDAFHAYGLATLYVDDPFMAFPICQTTAVSSTDPLPPWSLNKAWNEEHPEQPAYRFILGVSGRNYPHPKAPKNKKRHSDDPAVFLEKHQAALAKAFGTSANKGKYQFISLEMPTRETLARTFADMKQQMLKQLTENPNAVVDLVFLYRGHGFIKIADAANQLQGSALGILCLSRHPGDVARECENRAYDPEQDPQVITNTGLYQLIDTDTDLEHYARAGRLRKTILPWRCHAGSDL